MEEQEGNNTDSLQNDMKDVCESGNSNDRIDEVLDILPHVQAVIRDILSKETSSKVQPTRLGDVTIESQTLRKKLVDAHHILNELNRVDYSRKEQKALVLQMKATLEKKRELVQEYATTCFRGE